jgi:ankyrin repeat protein
MVGVGTEISLTPEGQTIGRELGNSVIFGVRNLEWGCMTFDEVHRVINRGNLERLRSELDAGLNPNLTNRYSWTILMLAAMEGNTRIGRLLLEKGADHSLRNKFGDTALSLAMFSGHPSFVKLLFSSRASLDCHPHGISLDVYLNWVEQYSGSDKHTVKNIRELLEQERRLRAEEGSTVPEGGC